MLVHESKCYTEEFRSFLYEALRNVEEKYWTVSTAYEAQFVRECTFCYELYQQMRRLQESGKYSNSQFFDFNGEIDKRGYLPDDEQNEQNKAIEKNPDFVIHHGGDNEYNMVVMEVKGCIDARYKKGIEKDFEMLSTFISNQILRYRFDIFLLYGHTQDELKFLLDKRSIPVQKRDGIYVITIKSKNSAP